MKYVRIYVVVSIIYIPLTVYGTFKELRENSNLYVAVYNLIKNYFLSENNSIHGNYGTCWPLYLEWQYCC